MGGSDREAPGDHARGGRPPRDRAPEAGSPGRSGIVLLANRLPVDRAPGVGTGTGGWRRGAGGLVTALHAAAGAGSTWIGCVPGRRSGLTLPVPENSAGIRLREIELSPQEWADHYDGYANATLWPLYHDVVELPRFRREWWRAYRDVNERFARAAAVRAAPGGVVWVHDYQLQLVPGLLRELRPDLRIGFFLHVPVPELEVFRRLPQRTEILRGLCGADLIGLQRPAGVAALLRLLTAIGGVSAAGVSAVGGPAGGGGAVRVGRRTVRLDAFPASVDTAGIAALAAASAADGAPARLRSALGGPPVLIASVERLDYTKGAEYRLAAFADALATGRLPAGTTLLQVAPATRQNIREYRALRRRVLRQVERINAQLGGPGRPVVHHWERSLTIEELVGLYLAADVMAVTPLRDGMNLVAKEYAAARVDEGGALVLSEFAGAADELAGWAYPVNPYDQEGMRDALSRAAHADPAERTRRMRAMRAYLDHHDARRWSHRFLAALTRPADAPSRSAVTGATRA